MNYNHTPLTFQFVLSISDRHCYVLATSQSIALSDGAAFCTPISGLNQHWVSCCPGRHHTYHNLFISRLGEDSQYLRVGASEYQHQQQQKKKTCGLHIMHAHNTQLLKTHLTQQYPGCMRSYVTCLYAHMAWCKWHSYPHCVCDNSSILYIEYNFSLVQIRMRDHHCPFYRLSCCVNQE